MFALQQKLRKVRFRAYNPNTAPFFPALTNPKLASTGDEIVTWNTAPGSPTARPCRLRTGAATVDWSISVPA